MVADAYYFGRSIDVRTEPHHVSILSRTVRESGTVVTDLIKWADVYNPTLDVYAYGDTGNIYKRTSARSYSLLRTVNNSHGNGLAYNPEDNFFYYTTDTTIGRYGSMTSGSPQFSDDFLGAQGGIPLNTNSLSLVAASSQYAYRADTVSLSITGDLTIEAQIKPTSLPTIGNTMTLVSKWNGSGNIRSYKFDIACVSGYFGSGVDGTLTISADGTEAPIDSACTGTSGTNSLTATNASFAVDQVILIHQSQGTGAGTWQKNTIAGYTAGTITLGSNLNASYTTGAQVRVLKQYDNVTINSGQTYLAKAWNGTTGGILAFLYSGTLTVPGNITGTGCGFRGGTANNAGNTGGWGEGTSGPANANSGGNNSNNGNGGGGAVGNGDNACGGDGGNGSSGATGNYSGRGLGGSGGSAVSSNDLTTMNMGGGGGGGGSNNGTTAGNGGRGGAIIFITGATAIITGSISNDGVNGTSGQGPANDGGKGAGGSTLIKTQNGTLGSGLITANSNGQIHLDYYTLYTGTTSPTLDATQDNNLVTNTSYQLRLSVSNDGTAFETLAKTVALQTGIWQHVAVSWDASVSQATFFLNTVSQDTAVGAITSIHDNASQFFVGCNKNDAGSAANFYDGLMDEVRVWNVTKTDADLLGGFSQQIAVNSANLQAYYKLNGDVTDANANANALTASGSPTYSSDVPFSSPTTRLDIDQTASTTGQVYNVPIAISESITNRKTFTPEKDPQKSIAVYIDTIGTGNWTITVHDTLNNVLATKTVANASLNTGMFEFIFATVWRPLTNFTNDYHFHITSTVADGKVKTSGADDLETVTFTTYFQFLVEDNQWHAICRFLNFICILNERYVAKYEATLYEPHKLVFGAEWRARCYGYWQEYLVIGCMKGSNIYDYDQGRIYFWDGYSPTFNFYVDVPEGGVNALLGTRGSLYIWAGWHADLLVYEGGSSARKLKDNPLLNPEDYAEVYPQAAAMWQANIRYGLAGNSNSGEMNRAVYTYGSKNYRYEDILTCDYPISTGNYLSTVKIGIVMPFNRELLVSWKDNVSCGMDYINIANAPYPTAYLQLMVEDSGASYKEKQALQLVATMDPLLTGESINVKYMNEETDSTWNTNSDSPAVGDITVRKIIPNGRFYHMNVAVDLTTSGSTSPTLKSLVLQTEQNEEEDVIG